MVFSGSGRHRRPTQADRAVAAAGVAGVGLALPLLTAAGAHAAPVSTWDSVAQCETGGNWAKNAGDGTYGGLHITLRTWNEYGGDLYAVQPDHATREQQISVAERILADQGPTAWPGCATMLPPAAQAPTAPSLPTVPPVTVPGVPAPATPSTTSPTAGQPSTQPPAQAPATSATPTPPAQSPAAPATPAPGTPTPGASAPTTSAPTASTPATPAPAAPTTDAPQSPVATVPSTPAPGTTPATSPVPAQPTSPAPAAGTDSYTVVPGDTLSGISDAHRLGGWHHLYEDNLSTVGANPDLIHPGQKLHLS